MKIVFALFLAAFSLTSAKCQDKIPMSRHAFSLVTNGYIWTSAPYLKLVGQVGIKYDWIPSRHGYLSIGLQSFTREGDKYFALPVEANIGLCIDDRIVFIGAGFIAHQEARFFEPALFPTLHFQGRIRLRKINGFVDFLGKIIWTHKYKYSQRFNHEFRDGWTLSPGIGMNLGLFL